MNRLPVVVALAGFALLVAGCGDGQQVRDVEDIPAQDPAKVEIYNNVDQYPNIVRVCIDGVAFATTTREYEPVLRVPEWDSTFCETVG